MWIVPVAKVCLAGGNPALRGYRTSSAKVRAALGFEPMISA